MAEPITAVLATMHGKERAIAPLLQRTLGVAVKVPAGLDTDRFGTFSRDVPRTGTPEDAARAKIAAAFERMPRARVGLASEGSFGPHPQVPFLPVDGELVMLVDRRDGLELTGYHLTPRTNFAHTQVQEMAAAEAFAARIGFPSHGLIVMGSIGGQPAPTRLLRKNIATVLELHAAVAKAIARCGAAHLETDMRAHRNPTRMRAIRRATVDLLRRYRSCCPRCARPGFVVSERVPGLPCAACGSPTAVTVAEVVTCAGCAYRIERAAAAPVADPSRCDLCNP